MGKPSPPTPPDPYETGAAQTSTNIGTAIANNEMQMVDQYTPWGNLEYNQTGTYYYTDPNFQGNQSAPVYTAPPASGGSSTSPLISALPSGTPVYGSGTPAPGAKVNSAGPGGGGTPSGTYAIPQYSATVSLPEEQQAALDAQFAANQSLSETAADQAEFLSQYMGQQISTDGMAKYNASLNPLKQKRSIGPAGAPVGSVSTRDLSSNINNNLAIQGAAPGAGEIVRGFGVERSGPDTYGQDFSENRREVEGALMGRMDPYLEQNRAALETQLANQGISRGSEAWNNAMRDLERQENDARMAAILGASEEQARMVGMERDRAQFELGAQNQDFGQAQARGNFANQAQQQQYNQGLSSAQFANAAQAQDFSQAAQRTGLANATAQQRLAQDIAAGNFANQAQAQTFGQQAQNAAMYNNAEQAQFNSELTQANLDNAVRQQMLNEALALRNQPINEITALLSGAQVQQPNLSMQTPGAIPTTDYAGLINQNYNQQMGNYNAEMSSYNNLMGGLFGLGAAGIGLI